jgi:hypothetical protein
MRQHRLGVAAVALACVTVVAPANPATSASAFVYRGVLGGSSVDYVDLLDDLGMNLLIHFGGRGPWIVPDTSDEIAHVGELAGRRPGVRVGYAIGQHDAVCYSNPLEFEALKAKVSPYVEMGLRAFLLKFDDTPPRFTCPLDVATYANLGEAQSDIANRLLDWLPSDTLLVFVPVEYYGTEDTDYKRALRTSLDERARVVWTGPEVVSATITREDAETYRSLVSHELFLWDNYPVNDWSYSQGATLFMGPLRGRDPDLHEVIEGMLSLVMGYDPQLSKVAVGTAAAFQADPIAYQDAAVRETAWEASIARTAGAFAGALRRFAAATRPLPNNAFETTRRDPAPEYDEALRAFWSSWEAPDWMPTAQSLRALMTAALQAANDLESSGLFGDRSDVFRVKFGQGAAAVLAGTDALEASRPRLDAAATSDGSQVTVSGVAAPSSPLDAGVAFGRAEREEASYRALAVSMYGFLIERFFASLRPEMESYLGAAEPFPRIESVTVQGESVVVDDSGAFSHAVSLGADEIRVVAADSLGRTTGVVLMP